MTTNASARQPIPPSRVDSAGGPPPGGGGAPACFGLQGHAGGENRDADRDRVDGAQLALGQLTGHGRVIAGNCLAHVVSPPFVPRLLVVMFAVLSVVVDRACSAGAVRCEWQGLCARTPSSA